MRIIHQELVQAPLLVAATDPPDGGPIIAEPGGDCLDRFPGSNSQDDTGMLDREPGQVAGLSDRSQDREISVRDGDRTRFAATHGRTSEAKGGCK
jgi:hypothetical protein